MYSFQIKSSNRNAVLGNSSALFEYVADDSASSVEDQSTTRDDTGTYMKAASSNKSEQDPESSQDAMLTGEFTAPYTALVRSCTSMGIKL